MNDHHDRLHDGASFPTSDAGREPCTSFQGILYAKLVLFLFFFAGLSDRRRWMGIAVQLCTTVR